MKNVAKKSLIIAGGIIGGIVAFIVLMAFLFVLLEPAIFNGFYKTAAKEFDNNSPKKTFDANKIPTFSYP